jgi:hypothetical protein
MPAKLKQVTEAVKTGPAWVVFTGKIPASTKKQLKVMAA